MKKLLLAGVLAVAITAASAQTTKPAVKAKTGTTAKKPAAKKPVGCVMLRCCISAAPGYLVA